MTTTTANRPSLPSPSPMPTAAPPASTVSTGPTEATSWADVAGSAAKSVLLAGATPALLPYLAVKSTYEQARGVSKSAQVLGERTAAAALGVDESSSTQMKIKGKLVDGVVYAETAGQVSVEKTKDGYTVERSLADEAGVSLPIPKLNKDGTGLSLEAEAGLVTDIVITNKVKTAGEADKLVGDFKAKAAESVVKDELQRGPATGPFMKAVMLPAGHNLASEFEDAASVKTSIAGKLNAEAALWKSETKTATEMGIELGLKVEGEHKLQMEVVNEGGKKVAKFTEKVQVSTEAELGLEKSPLDEVKLSSTVFGQSNEVAVSRTITVPLPDDFEMAHAASPLAVLAAARAAKGKATEEVTVDVKTQVGNQLVEGSLKVEGGMRNALKVAGATLGVGDATGINVEGEVCRTVSRTGGATVELGDAAAGVSFDVETEHKKKLAQVKTPDVRSFIGEIAKKSMEGTLTSARLTNAR